LRSAATGEAGRAATGVLAGSSTTIRAGTGVGEDKAPVRCAIKYPLTAVASPAATISTNLTTKREKTEASLDIGYPSKPNASQTGDIGQIEFRKMTIWRKWREEVGVH